MFLHGVVNHLHILPFSSQFARQAHSGHPLYHSHSFSVFIHSTPGHGCPETERFYTGYTTRVLIAQRRSVSCLLPDRQHPLNSKQGALAYLIGFSKSTATCLYSPRACKLELDIRTLGSLSALAHHLCASKGVVLGSIPYITWSSRLSILED